MVSSGGANVGEWIRARRGDRKRVVIYEPLKVWVARTANSDRIKASRDDIGNDGLFLKYDRQWAWPKGVAKNFRYRIRVAVGLDS